MERLERRANQESFEKQKKISVGNLVRVLALIATTIHSFSSDRPPGFNRVNRLLTSPSGVAADSAVREVTTGDTVPRPQNTLESEHGIRVVFPGSERA